MAEAGTAIAFSSTRATICRFTAVPGRNAPLGLGASIHTSTVVLLGSSAGLISVTLPSALKSPGAVIVAGSPTFRMAASILRYVRLRNDRRRIHDR